MEFEPIIGLEIHVQLNTISKMFTRAPYRFGAEPNTLTDPLVMGLPGTLPVLNWGAIQKTIRVGLMFNCKIADLCKWDRKNYFYPDLPKGYQLSQYDKPICIGGEVELEMPGPARNIMGLHRSVTLTRIHLEEDVGKLSHYGNESLIDYNRAGTPLIEIVTEPDIYSADEAFAFLTSLKTHMQYVGISDCDMEKGQMRCDANISVRPKGQKTLGTKVEIKNLNTISGVRNGIEYEIKRQIETIQKGGVINQETRRWNAEKNITTILRSKENAHDYRYFPDPDLLPVKLDSSVIEAIQVTIPEKPFDKQRRFLEQYSLPYTVTSVLCPDKELADFFEHTVALCQDTKMVANFIANDLLRELSNAGTNGSISIQQSLITPQHLADLVLLIKENVISKQMAQDIFIEMFNSKKNPREIVKDKGLEQTADIGVLEGVCMEVLKENEKAVKEFLEGKEKAINALKGQVMKKTQGKANAEIVDKVLKDLINRNFNT